MFDLENKLTKWQQNTLLKYNNLLKLTWFDKIALLQ